ncbi:MAG: response regulator [Defluviitaleaceae bacterium]|nr:response regulator [Defluviitaleaceae bacterium]MCL2263502.1 response regulator [Defluviitaleaceae bacterium]MCL2263930.1 response regulator [Defluviitaleaceae bacterium]
MENLEVMVVDDQPSVCKEIASFLKERCNVHAFKSGKDALAYLEKNHVDFIVLDYYMPEMTGFQVLLTIRENKATRDTPVVFLTTEVSERMEYEMKQRGANDYLCKPVDSAKLQECIRKHTSKA